MQEPPSEALQAATVSLEAEEARLVQGLEQLRLKEQAIVADLKRVGAALAALRGRAGGAEKSRAKARGDRPSRPGLSDAHALELVQEALVAGPLSLDGLKTRLLRKIRDRGLSGTGIQLALKRVLRDERFEESAGSYLLKTDAKATS